ncbi:MAG: hypothetical protein L0196_08470 [candidate division Zixibacteria bacterium]|nr:hypothetical protein [candidate division Zixibacteria bacterium]
MGAGAIIGIIIWSAGAWLTFGFIYAIRRDERRGTGSTKASVNMTMIWCVSLILIPVFGISPYHLLWAFPLGYVLGLLSLIFPFSILSILGRVFWRLCCIGIDWEEAAKNRQKYGRFTELLAGGATPEEAAQEVQQENIAPKPKAIITAQRLTYKPGAYSQVLLPDGERVFVSVRPMAITVRRQILAGFFPSSLLWSFDVPFLIRKVSAAGEPGASMMEIVLHALESCQSLSDVAAHLDAVAKPKLLLIINGSSV